MQVDYGQPFEVIDGNNLYFISGVFEKLFKEIN